MLLGFEYKVSIFGNGVNTNKKEFGRYDCLEAKRRRLNFGKIEASI